MEMNGRRVVVTGGSSGIGLGVAREIVKAGGEVCLVARRPEPLEVAAAGLGAAAWTHICDVSDPEAVDGLSAAVADHWGGLEGVVNCAGIAPMATAEETEPEVWDRTFEVNVRGPFLVIRSLVGPLRDGGGSIVSISSTLAEKPIPGMAAYNASKAALNQLTRSLALELAPAVRVNAVMPAVVDTPIHESRGLDREVVVGMGRLHPLQRIGLPEDIAAMTVFLLSEQASWVTGAVIPVDGGMLAT